MRYLRMLSNSLIAGALATCYVLIVFLQLNPRLPLTAAGLVPLATTIGLFYAVHLSAIFYGLLVAGQLPRGGGDPIRLLPDYCVANLVVRFGLLSEDPLTSADVRARTLWSILSADGVHVGVVNWPLTRPAPVVLGYVVSDAYARLALTRSGLHDPSLVYPPDLSRETLAVVQASAFEAVPPAEGADDLVARLQLPGQIDRLYDRLTLTLNSSRSTQVTLVRYQSLDPVGHYFLRYAVPSEFGDVSEEERRRYGAVLESHYGQIDEIVGRAIRSLAPDDLLLVVSGYGMEPLGLGKRALEQVVGDPDVSGSHERAPDGFLMAYGGEVARGNGARRASVVDIVPTVLYFLALPIGRDMDGYARTDLFRPAFTAERPITSIPSYER